MMPPRILIAGIGNIFLGDDAFGFEVARRSGQRTTARRRAGRWTLASAGFDLTYALLDGYDAAILVDAAREARPAPSMSSSPSRRGSRFKTGRRWPA